MPERDIRATVGYQFDPRGSQQFIQANTNMIEAAAALHTSLLQQGKDSTTIAREMAAFHESQNRAAESSQRLATETATVSSRFRESIAAARASITTDVEKTRAIEQQTEALKRYQAVRNQQAGFAITGLPEPSLGAVTGTGRQSRRTGALATFGTSVRNLPDIGPTTEIANVLIGVDRITGALGISAAATAAAVGALTGALVIVAGAIAIYTHLTKDQTNATIGLVKSQERYFQLLREAGTREAEAELRAAEQRLDDLRAQRTELQAELDRQFAGKQGVQGDFLARVNVALTRVIDAGEEAITGRLGELDTQLIETSGLVTRLTGGLEDNAFVVNDLVDAFQNRFNGALEEATGLVTNFVDQNEARIQAQIQATNEEFSFRQRAVELRRSGTIEQLNQIREQNAVEFTLNRERIRRLQEFAGRSDAADTELERLTTRQAELTAESRILHDEVEPLIRQRQREMQVVAELNRLGAIFGNVFGALRQDLSGLDVSKQLAKITDITQKRDERIAELETQRTEREEQAQKEATKAFAEADRKAADDRLKLFEDNYKALREIERRFTRSFQTAVGERDALAAFHAQQARADEILKLQENNVEREKEIQQALERERLTLSAHRRETLQIAQDTTQKQILQERQKAQKLIDEQNRSIDLQLRAAFSFTNTLDALFNTGYRQIEQNAQIFANNLASVFLGNNRPTGGAISNVFNSLFGGGNTLPPATPSYNAGTGVQQMITLPNGQRQQGYVVYSPTIIGQTAQQTLQQINQHSVAFVQRVYGQSAPR